MKPKEGNAPLACVPGALPAAERDPHFALIRSLFGAVEAVRVEADAVRVEAEAGYAFRLPVSALEPVARFVRNERRCCPFLDFVIDVGAGADRLELRMTGPEGTVEFLERELGLGSGGDAPETVA